jgi:hypothetical protein
MVIAKLAETIFGTNTHLSITNWFQK